ncbi:hypothetical protein D3C87_1602770 [compost metagenome]
MPRATNGVSRIGIVVGIQAGDDGATDTRQWRIDPDRRFTGNVRFADQSTETCAKDLDVLGINVDEGVICSRYQWRWPEVKNRRFFVVFGRV